ncbi:MAG: DUF1361 domain-containing protein [Anaerolineales bacterium]|jgi:uncharacterized membrane protein
MRDVLTSLNHLHRFLSSQLLYPLVLSTFLAGVLFIIRVLFSHSFTYKYLVWNLFLAWVPYGFSLWAAALNRRNPRSWWLLIIPGSLWLIFFPNAPYILTDFLHLEERPRIPLWYDIALLASFTWTGFFLAIASLRTMQILVRNYLGWILSWFFAGGVLSLGGLGIYLGRFSRWNSWDLFLHPKGVVLDVLYRFTNPLTNLRFYVFTTIFTAFLLVCYLTFISVRRFSESERIDGKRDL